MNNVFNRNTSATKTGMSAQEFAQAYLPNVNIQEYSEGLRPSEVEDFKKFIDFIRRGLPMIDRIGMGVDRAGKSYKFYNFIRAKGPSGCKIFPIGEWDKMVEDYLDGNLQINFTAAELVDAMMNPNI